MFSKRQITVPDHNQFELATHAHLRGLGVPPCLVPVHCAFNPNLEMLQRMCMQNQVLAMDVEALMTRLDAFTLHYAVLNEQDVTRDEENNWTEEQRDAIVRCDLNAIDPGTGSAAYVSEPVMNQVARRIHTAALNATRRLKRQVEAAGQMRKLKDARWQFTCAMGKLMFQQARAMFQLRAHIRGLTYRVTRATAEFFVSGPGYWDLFPAASGAGSWRNDPLVRHELVSALDILLQSILYIRTNMKLPEDRLVTADVGPTMAASGLKSDGVAPGIATCALENKVEISSTEAAAMEEEQESGSRTAYYPLMFSDMDEFNCGVPTSAMRSHTERMMADWTTEDAMMRGPILAVPPGTENPELYNAGAAAWDAMCGSEVAMEWGFDPESDPMLLRMLTEILPPLTPPSAENMDTMIAVQFIALLRRDALADLYMHEELAAWQAACTEASRAASVAGETEALDSGDGQPQAPAEAPPRPRRPRGEALMAELEAFYEPVLRRIETQDRITEQLGVLIGALLMCRLQWCEAGESRVRVETAVAELQRLYKDEVDDVLKSRAIEQGRLALFVQEGFGCLADKLRECETPLGRMPARAFADPDECEVIYWQCSLGRIPAKDMRTEIAKARGRAVPGSNPPSRASSVARPASRVAADEIDEDMIVVENDLSTRPGGVRRQRGATAGASAAAVPADRRTATRVTPRGRAVAPTADDDAEERVRTFAPFSAATQQPFYHPNAASEDAQHMAHFMDTTMSGFAEDSAHGDLANAAKRLRLGGDP